MDFDAACEELSRRLDVDSTDAASLLNDYADNLAGKNGISSKRLVSMKRTIRSRRHFIKSSAGETEFKPTTKLDNMGVVGGMTPYSANALTILDELGVPWWNLGSR